MEDLATAEKFFSHVCLDGSISWMWRTKLRRWCITNKHKGSFGVHEEKDTIAALEEFITTCKQADARESRTQ